MQHKNISFCHSHHNKIYAIIENIGAVAHLARALQWHCRGSRFKSDQLQKRLISAGLYGYLQRDAIRVAIETMKLHQDDFDEITLVLFGEREFGFAEEEYPEFIN